MALETARRIHNRGHDVFFAAGTDDRGTDSFWPELRESSLSGVSLRYLTRPTSPSDVPALMELTRLFQKRKPDCVHLHTSKAGTLGVLAARLAGVPRVVYSSHGHLFHEGADIDGVSLTGAAYYLYFWLRRLTVGLADRVVALSEQDRREQVQLGIGPAGRYRVIPNGVSMDEYETRPDPADRRDIRRSLSLPAEGPMVVHVGRLVREKGQQDLIRALIEHPDLADVTLVLVGGGPRRSELEELTNRLDLTSQVYFAGVQSDVVPYLRSADLFCFPSRYESQGLALMEAMAVGLPCISTLEGGLRELVKEGRTAHVVNPGNPRNWALAMVQLLNNKDDARRLGERARARVKHQYSMTRTTERTLDCYESI